jgi:three-Cys-motif partner protein
VADRRAHISKRSTTRALKVQSPFDGFYFIDLNADNTEYLRELCGQRDDVVIYTGDSNKYLIETVLPKIQFKNFTPALCLLDPYGLHLDWEVKLKAGQSKAVDMFLNFPVLDMNRAAGLTPKKWTS